MTRILHILDHSLPLHSGYSFRTRAIFKAQMARGWDVAGVTGVRHQASGGQFQTDIETIDGLQFFRTDVETAGPSPLKEWREISALADRIDALCDSWKPDILHAHSPVLDGLAAARVAKRRNIPLVYEIRAFWEDAAVGNGTGKAGSGKYWLTRQLENHVISSADAVAVICQGLKSDLLRRGVRDEKIIVSPNGVDLELFGEPQPADPALIKQYGLDGADVIGFIGSFYDYEGLDDLISAMPKLVENNPNSKLLLVGGGPKEEELRAQAKASSASEAILFVGRVPHEEVENYYSLIDVLAYPRKSMRLTDLVTPLKPLEAMAQGRLVAASDVGGHKELIEDGVTGTLFSADNPSGIADALSKLLANRSDWEKRRKVARAFVESERNWSSNILRYEPIYQKLVADRSANKAA